MISVLIFGFLWWSLSQNPVDKEIGYSNVLTLYRKVCQLLPNHTLPNTPQYCPRWTPSASDKAAIDGAAAGVLFSWGSTQQTQTHKPLLLGSTYFWSWLAENLVHRSCMYMLIFYVHANFLFPQSLPLPWAYLGKNTPLCPTSNTQKTTKNGPI